MAHIDELACHADNLDKLYGQAFNRLQDDVLNEEQASSLMNDISYVKRIEKCARTSDGGRRDVLLSGTLMLLRSKQS
ncbi:hypothetical protein LP123_09145 [Moraxella bovis]|uniref:Uncharacterized protein n=1 Tax=Moraxella bovis TaxID=476 RepID=A0AAQ2T3R4_MORBO|nr:hypothetical protein [Moraxella bovis]AWY20645.1 hypothetical protein DQF64_09190 [Moraxella bovis]OOR92507.1 hypothetical protein B0182_00405 [Moraxella bovis]UYZ76676.1 hypothetical protein LP093_05125 [Moraxella bovis]UYZ77371.1 hypothetical protein LP115_08685 [Moraxella bovis]UYZ82150.1 hypothetical protein LP113_05440 [Moraxella bovis]